MSPCVTRKQASLGALVLMLVLVFPGLAAAEVIYSQGFESASPPSLPSGCTSQVVQIGDGTEGVWATATGTVHPDGEVPYNGTRLAYFNSYLAASGSRTRLRLGGPLDLRNYSQVHFYVWVYHDSGYSGSDDRIQVQVSTNGGSSWTNVGDPISRYSFTLGWREASVDLSDYDGEEEVLVGILGIADYLGNDIHIDDISIEGDYDPSSSSSGCSTGILNPLFLLFLAPMGLLLKKSR